MVLSAELFRVVFLRLIGPAAEVSGGGGGISLRLRGVSTVGDVGGGGDESLGRRLRGSSPFSILSRICSVCTDKSKSTSGVESEGKVGGSEGESGGGTEESSTRCVGQSFRSVIVTVLSTPSRTVVVGPVLFSTLQSGHLEGGTGRAKEFVGIGASSLTGSTAVQDMEACLSPQCVQKLGWALLTTRGLPRCVDLSKGVEGLQIGSQELILLSLLSLSEV